MAHNKVNMSLDEIIKENRGYQGGRNMRGTRGRGRGGRVTRGNRRASSTNRNRSLSNSRSRSGNRNSRSQSANRRGFLRNTAPRGGIKTVRGAARGRGRGIVRGQRGISIRGRLSRRDTIPIAQNGGRRSRSTSRGRFQNNNNNIGNNRSRSRSQSRNRQSRSRSRSRTRFNNLPRGIATRGRGRGGNFRQTLIQRGGLTTRQNTPQNRIGLRSDLIARAQRRDTLNEKLLRAQSARGGIRSQTFTRSREPSTGLTVSVANEFALRTNARQQLPVAGNRRPLRRRRNSNSGVSYLDSRSLAQLAAALGGSVPRRKGPGSVNSNRSRRSAQSNRSGRSAKRVLNPRLQKEIATIQGRVFEAGSTGATGQPQPGINFTPTPHLTATSLSDRFSSM